MQNRRQFLMSGVAAATATAALGVAPAFAGGHGRIGEFTGKSNHVTKGRAELVEQDGKIVVNLLDDFWFDGAPDPKVALGNNGYDKSTLVGTVLTSNTGAQSYVIPNATDGAKYNEVWIWCEKFNVPLGVAKLN
ncbi:MAG: DM13 domain-containing protein [Pseudomonadota bacterium]